MIEVHSAGMVDVLGVVMTHPGGKISESVLERWTPCYNLYTFLNPSPFWTEQFALWNKQTA